MKTDHKLYLFAGIIFVLKCCLLPWVQVTDADAVTRTLITVNWMEHPFFMDTANWAPFHFYFNASILYLWDNQVIAPVFLNILFSCLTFLPFYFFVKREFNEQGAFFATVFLAFSPILLRTGFLALAETPFLFLLALSLNLVSKSIREKNIFWISVAGFCITLAAGFRYDAWVLIAVFSLGIWIYFQFKYAFVFGLTSILFPVYWMISNYLATGNPLHSIEANYHYTHVLVGVNDEVSFSSYLRRIWFYPFSLLIAIGPIVFYYTHASIFSEIKKGRSSAFFLWIFILAAVWIIYFYHSFRGNLLLHQRFTGTIILFTLPFSALFFHVFEKGKIKWVLRSVLFTIALSYAYNMHAISPLPRLKDQSIVEISKKINENITPESALIIDFFGWENTYFTAMESQLRPKQIHFIEGEKNARIQLEPIGRLISHHPQGILLTKKDSEFTRLFNFYQFRYEGERISDHISLDTLYVQENYFILQWRHGIPRR